MDGHMGQKKSIGAFRIIGKQWMFDVRKEFLNWPKILIIQVYKTLRIETDN